MDSLLKKQEKLLARLAVLLRQEKEVLIGEDGKRLMEIVKTKKTLQDELEAMEIRRKEEWRGLSLAEIAGSLDKKGRERLMGRGEAISIKMKEIKELQETNMMLTRQSAAYAEKMMGILQGTVRKSGITYGQNGAVESVQGVMASLDRSV